MTFFYDAFEITVGKKTWEPNTNLDNSQVVGNFASSVPSRANQKNKFAYVVNGNG